MLQTRHPGESRLWSDRQAAGAFLSAPTSVQCLKPFTNWAQNHGWVPRGRNIRVHSFKSYIGECIQVPSLLCTDHKSYRSFSPYMPPTTWSHKTGYWPDLVTSETRRRGENVSVSLSEGGESKFAHYSSLRWKSSASDRCARLVRLAYESLQEVADTIGGH